MVLKVLSEKMAHFAAKSAGPCQKLTPANTFKSHFPSPMHPESITDDYSKLLSLIS